MLFCGLHQSQQSALCGVIKEDITLDSMFTVKDKVETSVTPSIIYSHLTNTLVTLVFVVSCKCIGACL